MFIPTQQAGQLLSPSFGKSLFGGANGHGDGKTAPAMGQIKTHSNEHTQHSRAVLAEAHSMLEQRLNANLASKLEAVDPSSKLGAPPAAQSGQDFSPQAVSERIMGFIEGRIEQERASGASEERLKDLYNQAVKGVAQGFKEAKDIIESHGLLDGDVKGNFLETISLMEDGLSALKENLFGTGEASVDPVVAAPQATNPSSGNFTSSYNAVEYRQDRTFDMQVKTQDGDVVTIKVGGGEHYNAQSGHYSGAEGTVDAFSAEYSSYSNLSFSVEGDLDEAEMAALNDLFGQVNDIATTFYGGDVDKAFTMAMDVGYDATELSGFAVNMAKSEVVAVRHAYAEVGQSASKEVPAAKDSGRDSLFDALADFAGRVKNVEKRLMESEDRFNHKPLLVDLLSNLLGPKPVSDSSAPTAQHEAPWRQFVEGLVV